MQIANITEDFDFSQQQLQFIDQNGNSEWGTFKDSLRAPVHRWFTYPAGFSYKAVDHSLKKHRICRGMQVYDPFAGTGTTNLASKCSGIDSCGVEAHPLVFQIACTKLDWEVHESEIAREAERISETIGSRKHTDIGVMPELVRKCYDESTLKELIAIRDLIGAIPASAGAPFSGIGADKYTAPGFVRRDRLALYSAEKTTQ